MIKDKLKVRENQHSNANSSYNRLMRRSRPYWRLIREGVDPQWLYNYINSKMGVGKELTPQLMEHILFMASRGLFCFASTRWLAALMDCHEKSVCRITKELADIGIIRKWYRGMGRSVFLFLSPIFNNPVIQYTLAPLFPFLKAGAVSLLIVTNGYAATNLLAFARSLVSPHVTYNKNLTYLRNFTSCSVLKAQQSGGETPVKRSVLGRGIACASIPETFMLMNLRERLSWETLNVPIDPNDMHPRHYVTATATSYIKRSADYRFDPQSIPLKATHESFDLLSEILSDAARPNPVSSTDPFARSYESFVPKRMNRRSKFRSLYSILKGMR